MTAGVYCALVHHPVKDRAGETVTTAVTTLDVHDIARSARTYGLAGYFVVTPIDAQHVLIDRILEHWASGAGRRRMPERHDALTLVQTVHAVEDARRAIEEREGRPPALWATTARPPTGARPIDFDAAARLAGENRPILILFGTGHGLTDDLIADADAVLPAIEGAGGYNHLSVRSAVAIVLDRLWQAGIAQRP